MHLSTIPMTSSTTRSATGRRARRLGVAAAAIGTALVLTAPAAGATTGGADGRDHRTTTYAIRTLDDPADPTFNQLLGINDRGRIVGYFGSGQPGHPNRGDRIDLQDNQPTITNENFPGSAQTQVVGINAVGTNVGFWVDGAGANFGFVLRNGRFTSVTNPATPADARFDQLLGVNGRGIAVGFYNDADGASHGYTYNVRSGSFSPVVLPVAADSVTATGIDDAGDVSGFYVHDKVTTGFVLGHDGRFDRLSFGARTNTQALGLNGHGQVVGSYVDNAAVMHGFVWSRSGGLVRVDAPLGTGGTLVNGLNDRGQLVGFYVDAAGNTHGFLARRRG